MKVKEFFVKCVAARGRFDVKDFGHNGLLIGTLSSVLPLVRQKPKAKVRVKKS